MHKFFHVGQPSTSDDTVSVAAWNPREHMSPRVYVDKLLLSAARVNVLGNERDELIVKEVSAVMEPDDHLQKVLYLSAV